MCWDHLIESEPERVPQQLPQPLGKKPTPPREPVSQEPVEVPAAVEVAS